MSRILLQPLPNVQSTVANRVGLYAKTDAVEDKLVYQTDDGVEHVVMKNPLTTSQDLIVAGVGGVPDRLGKGVDGQALKMVAGNIAWSNVVENPMTAAGDIIIGGTSGAPAKLTVGSEDQVLKVTSGVPAWGTASGGILWMSATTATNAVNKNGYLLNSTSASFTVTLPASPTIGNEIGFLDVGGVCTTKPVTIARNGNLIQGLAEDLVIDFNSAAFSLVYSSTGWRVNNFIKGVKGEQGTPGSGGGMWELVERWEPSEAATSHTFTGLNGNIDRQYKIKASIINASSSAGSLLLQINDDTNAANYKNWRNYSQIAVSGAGFHISYHEAVCTLWANMDIQAKSGIYRSSITNGSRLISNGSDGSGDQSNSFWLNTTDEITSLTIYSNAANGIGVGSTVELWKLAQ